MKPAALGFHMHSGWGVLVAVSGDSNSVEVIDRIRIVITNPEMPGTSQPYHYAASLGSPESEAHIAQCAATSESPALAAIEQVVGRLNERQYRVAGSAVLMASGRSLPVLAKILSSHPMIHTAEGEFFRSAVRNACARLEISVESIPERELERRARATFGNLYAGQVERRIAAVGRSIGPPWTKDHKTATLAALIALSRASGGD